MIIMIISFILDGVISNLINYNSLMYPICSLLSLIIVYPYFNQNDNTYLVASFLLGILYDVVYTDTIFFNACLFLILALSLKKVFKKFSYKYFSVLITTLVSIVSYRTISYITLVLIHYLNYNIYTFCKGIYSSFIINIIYITLFYLISSKKLILRRMKT